MNSASDYDDLEVKVSERLTDTEPLRVHKQIEPQEVSHLEHLPRLHLPVKSIDQWPTSISIPSANSPHHFENIPPTPCLYLEDFSLNEQVTWIMPSLQHSSKLPEYATPTWAVESCTSQVRNLFRRSGIYTLSSLATPLVALVLTPFLTQQLTHSAYGALSVLNTAVGLCAGLTQLGLASAFFRAYTFNYEALKDPLRVLSTVVVLLSLILLPVVVLIALCAPLLAQILLQDRMLGDTVRLAGLVVVCQNLTVPGFAWMRAENRAPQFVLLSLTNLLLNFVLTLLFVGVWHMGLNGSLVALSAGYAVVALWTLPQIIVRAGLHLRRDIARNLLAFGLPNVVNFLSVWVLQLADRSMLASLSSLKEAAIYTVAYSLGSILGVLIISPFLFAWPSVLFTIARRREARRIFRLIFRWYSIILVLAAYALSLAGLAVLTLFFPPSYRAAAPIIPTIALSILLYGLYNYITLGASLRRKTWSAGIFTGSAALLNIAMNIFLIPRFGSMGAALATLLACLALLVGAYIVNQRIYHIPYEIGKVSFALVTGIGCFIASLALARSQPPVLAWSIVVGMFLCYAGSLVTLGDMRRLQRILKR